MATAETETSYNERVPPGGLVYDGFISYSHAADDLLAPRLQAGLQRFAKPWWKRRALRIFRDESSLSANPHLWSSITTALDQSAWFVLLLSPEAAESPWVNNEVEYWLEHKTADRIIPVLTDGDFTWYDEDFISDSAPPALEGAFSDEPRWVDLRFARSDEQLDLKNPQFSAAVADVASAIRGVPKDELESEEVQQHRRTVRTAWAAGVGLLLLALLAGAAAIFALDQRNEAEANAELAKARELSASSISVRDDDPELATLLSVEALHRGGPLFSEGLVGLRETVAANRLVGRSEYEPGDRISLAFTPDESGLVIASELGRSVSRFAPDDLENPLWVYEDLTTNDVFIKVAVHPDGSEIAVVVVDEPFAGDPGPEVVLDESGDDAFPGRVVLLDATTGVAKRTIPIGRCVEPIIESFAESDNHSGYGPNGLMFQLPVKGTDCSPDPGFEDTVVYDTATWEEVRRLSEIDGLREGHLSFTADGTIALLNFPWERVELRSWPDFELLQTFDFSNIFRDFPPESAQISPDGRYITFIMFIGSDHRPAFWDIEADQFLGWGDGYKGIATKSVFTSDGLALVAGTEAVGLYEPVKGRKRIELHTGGDTRSLAAATGLGLVATASDAAVVELWSIGNETGIPLFDEDGHGAGWINPNIIVEGEHVALVVFGDPILETPEGDEGWIGLLVIDPATGVPESEIYYYSHADALPDGRFVVAGDELGPELDPEEPRVVWQGPLAIWDPVDGALEIVRDCRITWDTSRQESDIIEDVCPDGEPSYAWSVRVSGDGTQFAGVSRDGEIRVWDVATLEVVRTVTPAKGVGLLHFGDGWFVTGAVLFEGGPSAQVLYAIDAETGAVLKELPGNWQHLASAVSHDGSKLFLMEQEGQASVYDTNTWDLVYDPWQAQQSKARGIDISPDDTKLAVSGEDGLVWIWQIDGSEPVRLDQIPAAADLVSDIMWIDDDRMGAALVLPTIQGAWQILDLSVDVLIKKAVDGLVRGFTPEECTTYAIDPCPSLEEMRSR